MKLWAFLTTFSAAAFTWQFALDAILKGVLLLLVACGTVLLMRKQSASARHLVWLVAVSALLVLPILSLTLPKWRVLPASMTLSVTEGSSVETVPAVEIVAERLPAEAATPVAEVVSVPVPVETAVTRAAAPMVSAPARMPVALEAGSAEISESEDRSWTSHLVLVWLVVAVLLILRLVISLIALFSLSCRSKRLTGGVIGAVTREVREQLGYRRAVRVYLHPRRRMPMSWGLLRGNVLLPAEALDWSEEQLRAVLLHEVGHLVRRDPLVQFFVQVACALHWFNPLVWFAAWRLHVERERACDDLVLQSGVKASDYAQHLLDVVSGYRLHGFGAVSAVAMARRSRLEGRLLAIMSEQRNRKSPTRRLIAVTLGLAVVLVLPCSMVHAQSAEDPEGERAVPAKLTEVGDEESGSEDLPGLEPKPKGLPDKERRKILEALQELNRQRLSQIEDPTLKSRLEQYEKAFQMQAHAAELFKKNPNMTPEQWAKEWEKLLKRKEPVKEIDPEPVPVGPKLMFKIAGRQVSAWQGERQIWSVTLTAEVAGQPLEAGRETIVVTTRPGQVFGIETKTGKILWRGQVEPAAAHPGARPGENNDDKKAKRVELLNAWSELVKARKIGVAHLREAHAQGSATLSEVAVAQQAFIEAKIGHAKAGGADFGELFKLHKEQLAHIEKQTVLLERQAEEGIVSSADLQEARSKLLEAKIKFLEAKEAHDREAEGGAKEKGAEGF